MATQRHVCRECGARVHSYVLCDRVLKDSLDERIHYCSEECQKASAQAGESTDADQDEVGVDDEASVTDQTPPAPQSMVLESESRTDADEDEAPSVQENQKAPPQTPASPPKTPSPQTPTTPCQPKVFKSILNYYKQNPYIK